MTPAEPGPYARPDPAWRNTWLCGPGVADWIIDTTELGPRVSMPWASGRIACVTDLATPDLLRAMNPRPAPHYPQRSGQMSLLEAR